MSRAKIFNMIKNRGTSQNGRNAFDLSGFESYSEKCQTINPVRVIDTIPSDYFNIKIDDFIQCAGPMKAASFVRGSREICAYYVPYNSIWHNYNQYQATREDPDSVLLQQKGIAAEPRFSLFGMYIQVASFFIEWINWQHLAFTQQLYADLSQLANFPTGDQLVDIFTNPQNFYYKQAIEVVKNTQITDYKNLTLTSRIGATNLATTGNLIVYPGFYNAIVDGGIGYTTPYLWSVDIVGQPCWSNACRKLDMLGYGNIYPVFDQFLRNWMDDTRQVSWAYFINNLPNVSSAQDLASGMSSLFGSFDALLQNLVFQLKCIVSVGTNITDYTTKFTDQFVNIYPMFAYNRCFYDMFRNSYYDLDYDVRNYNADFVNCQNEPSTVIYPVHTYPRFWKLEHHQYKKDMFTGILPDTQFGAVSSVDLTNVNIKNSVSSSSFGAGTNSSGVLSLKSSVTVNDVNNNAVYVPNASSVVSGSGSWNIPSAFDVFALRRAECLQQYRMDLLRAGNKTRDIFKQIYGSNPKSELDEAPYFIDVFGQSLKIDPIIATSETGQGNNGSLGDIAARITSRNNGSFKFSTQDFGCLLILDYTLIDPSYNSIMVDGERYNLNQESHFIPQLQNLGFEALFKMQLNMYKSPLVKANTLGFAPPYLTKKTYIDKVHGNMCSVIIPSHITEFGGLTYNSNIYDYAYVGNRSIWTVTRKDMQEADTTELKHFYGNPNILDDVMMLQVDATYDSDQFICHTMIEVNAVRQLSELGLPRFC